jgi:hypothetical protein
MSNVTRCWRDPGRIRDELIPIVSCSGSDGTPGESFSCAGAGWLTQSHRTLPNSAHLLLISLLTASFCQLLHLFRIVHQKSHSLRGADLLGQVKSELNNANRYGFYWFYFLFIPRSRLAYGKLRKKRHGKIAMDARPGGPTAKREPSPEGLGLNPEDDLSAGGAALNLAPLAPVSLGANSGFPTTRH